MHVRDALQQRQSIRAFLNKPVSREQIHRILDAARHAPSGTNTQPWQVAVLSGQPKHDLQQALINAHRSDGPRGMDFQYYPDTWIEPFKTRRRECGLQMYSTLGITREDKAGQQAQWEANYRAFDAPVMLLFFMDSIMQTGSYLDYGMLLQSIMLMALDEGLATCPQASLGEFPAVVKQQLGYDPSLVLLGGMALGYADTAAAINSYRTPRLAVDDFTRYFDEGEPA